MHLLLYFLEIHRNELSDVSIRPVIATIAIATVSVASMPMNQLPGESREDFEHRIFGDDEYEGTKL